MLAGVMLDALAEVSERCLGARARAPAGRDAFLAAFAQAGRGVGRAPVAHDEGARARLAAAGIDWPIAARADELFRVALLADAAAQPNFATLVDECFRGGDSGERRAVLRALPLLPEPERFVPLATEACRTNVLPVFEAIACENPYPARYFPEPPFNQLALKAAFLGVALARILGLAGRHTAELARMARDYASERRAAGRPVPVDLALLLDEAKP